MPVQGNYRNAVTNPIAEQMGVPIMHNWNQTVPLWQLHHHYHARWAHAGYSNGDCKPPETEPYRLSVSCSQLRPANDALHVQVMHGQSLESFISI